jgi:hypothetical protein
MPKKMNHGEYQAKVKKMSDAALRYVIKDAREAMAAMPDGENVGYYADEINYCCSELYRRGDS